eukprot:204991_1
MPPKLKNSHAIGSNAYNMYTLQLNPNHPYDLTAKILQCSEFCNNIQTVTVHMKIDTKLLTSCISNYYNNTFTPMEKELFKPQMETILDLASMKQHELKLRSTPYVTQIKQKICKLFDNLINIQSIELTDEHNNWVTQDTISTDYGCHIIIPNDIMNIK